MDHHLAIRFQVDADELENLTADYEPIEWEEIKSQFETPPYFDEFDGRWLASAISSKSCYRQTKASKDIAIDNYLVIDRDNNTVYGTSDGLVGSWLETPEHGDNDFSSDESGFTDSPETPSD